MEMGMGWYGPLIDLRDASTHLGQIVQLIVFLHRTTPIVEYKLQGRCGDVVRTDIQVGDETRPLFRVSIWNHNPSLSPGDILFLRNVKLISFGSNCVEARTLHFSCIIPLIHPFSSPGPGPAPSVHHFLTSCRVSLVGFAKDKLTRLLQWLLSNQHFRSLNTPASRNCKVYQDRKAPECLLLSEALNMSCPNVAIFLASIGEIFLHSLCPHSKIESLFISRRLTSKTDIVVEDMICLGCQLCGVLLSTNSKGVVKNGPLHCEKSSNRLHVVGLIYRPFMLYVWDNSDYVPLLVTNKEAELLFGNIIAEKVYESYKCQKDEQQLENPNQAHVPDYEKVEGKVVGSSSSVGALGLELRKTCNAKSPNLYMIWLIVLKMLLLQGGNSSLKFEVLVSPGLEIEDGRFKMMSVSMSYVKL